MIRTKGWCPDRRIRRFGKTLLASEHLQSDILKFCRSAHPSLHLFQFLLEENRINSTPDFKKKKEAKKWIVGFHRKIGQRGMKRISLHSSNWLLPFSSKNPSARIIMYKEGYGGNHFKITLQKARATKILRTNQWNNSYQLKKNNPWKHIVYLKGTLFEIHLFVCVIRRLKGNRACRLYARQPEFSSQTLTSSAVETYLNKMAPASPTMLKVCYFAEKQCNYRESYVGLSEGLFLPLFG